MAAARKGVLEHLCTTRAAVPAARPALTRGPEASLSPSPRHGAGWARSSHRMTHGPCPSDARKHGSGARVVLESVSGAFHLLQGWFLHLLGLLKLCEDVLASPPASCDLHDP